VDDEMVSQEAEAYDCDTCEVMTRITGLDDDNREAWALYRRCCNRFLVDLQAGHLMLQRATEELDSETFVDRCERLRVLYDVMQPPKEP
jgi:hypothetical protein